MKRQNILLIFNNLEKENKNLDYNNPWDNIELQRSKETPLYIKIPLSSI
jgi:hypothetical protein